MVGRSYLWRDLFHGVNKVVYLHVQPGTLQNHSLHLFDGRCQIFIWGKKNDFKAGLTVVIRVACCAIFM